MHEVIHNVYLKNNKSFKRLTGEFVFLNTYICILSDNKQLLRLTEPYKVNS